MKKLESIFSYLTEQFLTQQPEETARFLEQQDLQKIISFVTSLEIFQASLLLEHLNNYLSLECWKHFPKEDQMELLASLPPQRAASLLRLVPKAKQQTFLKELPQKVARTLKALVDFPSGTAGAFMDPKVCEVRPEATVQEIKKQVKRLSGQEIHQVYVVNSEGSLVGLIKMSDLLRAETNVTAQTLQQLTGSMLLASTSTTEILMHPGWQYCFELPVVDEAKRLLGVLSYSKLQALQEKNKRSAIRPINSILKLGEVSWIGMNAALEQATDWLEKGKADTQGKGK